MENFKEVLSEHEQSRAEKYAEFYEEWFPRINPRLVLEIGTAGHRGIDFYHLVWPEATVWGIDYDSNCAAGHDDVFCGLQEDTEFLQHVLDQIGIPDLVIDDGGHKMSQQRISFEHLFPQMCPGSYYIIEDLETSYIPQYIDEEPTFVSYLKGKIDDMNGYNHIPQDPGLTIAQKMLNDMGMAAPSGYDSWVYCNYDFMLFYRELCMIRKRKSPQEAPPQFGISVA